MPQALLSQQRVQVVDASLPQNHVIQQVRGVRMRGGRATAGLRQAGAAGQVHGHQPRRLHAHARLPRLAHPLPQSVQGLAVKGRFFMGWFFSFKMYLIINEKGKMLSFMITPGNVDDREPLKVKDFVREIQGKLVGDKGYIAKELFHELFVDGIQMITKVRNSLMSVSDKVLLRKKAVIESVNDELKNIAQLEHSKHHSFNNFIVNAVFAIAAYCFFPNKPSIRLE